LVILLIFSALIINFVYVQEDKKTL